MADDDRPADSTDPTPETTPERVEVRRTDGSDPAKLGPTDLDRGDAGNPTDVGEGVMQETSLGRGLVRAWEWIGDHSTWVVFGLIAVAALVYAYRLRQQSDFEIQRQSRQALTAMNDLVGRADRLRLLAGSSTRDQVADQVATLDNDLTSMMTLTRDADDSVAAHALRLQGDYYWLLATMPQPGAATRPSGEFPELPDNETRLSSSEAAFTRVLSDHPNATSDVRAALFGLAAIAEERGDFEAAGSRYDELLAMDNLPPIQEQQARFRKELLANLSAESRLAQPRAMGDDFDFSGDSQTPTTGPVTDLPFDFNPAATQPSAEPADPAVMNELLQRPDGEPAEGPATRPLTTITPSTRPATRPSEGATTRSADESGTLPDFSK